MLISSLLQKGPGLGPCLGVGVDAAKSLACGLRTVDDSISEAFDNVTGLLKIPWLPGEIFDCEEKLDVENEEVRRNLDLAAVFQYAAGALIRKLRLCMEECCKGELNVRKLVCSGGVARNGFVRERSNKLAMEDDFFPLPELCADNGVMITWA
ncbi:4190_t:CDS:2, partial [Paraglomus occultum]